MEIPSSPPVIPLLELPSGVSSPCTDHADRKRTYSDYGGLSSDPIFSDEVSEADSHFEGPRRKRNIKGPWFKNTEWDLANKRSSRKNTGLRSTDSGVFMGSDDSLASSSAGSISPATPDFGLSFDGACDFELSTTRKKTNDAESSKIKDKTSVAIAREMIASILDEGKEVVDFSDMKLGTIPDDLLQPLQQLVRHPHNDASEAPPEESFQPLVPRIQLYLQGNLLRALPMSMFNITNITVLSLRNNRLHKIPTAIGKLTALQELNIGGNNFADLPLALMKVFHGLKTLGMWPHCLAMTDREDQQWFCNFKEHALDGQSIMIPDYIRHVVQPSALRYGLPQIVAEAKAYCSSRAHAGKVSVLMEIAPTTHYDIFGDNLPRGQQAVITQGVSLAISLVEHCLHKILKKKESQDALDKLGTNAPPQLIAALHMTLAAETNGTDICTTCGRQIIIPRATWLEYWYHDEMDEAYTRHHIYPFRMVACSRGCVKPHKIGSVAMFINGDWEVVKRNAVKSKTEEMAQAYSREMAGMVTTAGNSAWHSA